MGKNETWEPIIGYERYEVSNLGRVRSFVFRRNNDPIILNAGSPSQGYMTVSLSKGDGICKTFSVHRLVAKAFINNSENLPIVNHLDGNKHNNNAENLVWSTESQNMKHAYKYIERKRPTSEEWSNCKVNRKLSKEQVLQMKGLFKTTRVKDIALMFGVSSNSIQQIKGGHTWKWVKQNNG